MKKILFVSAAALLSAVAITAPVYSFNTTRMEILQDNKVQIKAEDLPQAVKNTIETDYKVWTISKAYLHESTTQYEVEFTKEGEMKTIKFDKDGNVIA